MVWKPYSGRELAHLAYDHLGVVPDDYDLMTLMEAVEARRRRELDSLLTLAHLMAIAINDPKKMPTLDELMGVVEDKMITRAEFEARLARLK